MEPQILAVIERLGTAGILSVVLIVQLWQANKERRELNNRFLTALESTVQTNATTMHELSASIREATASEAVAHRHMEDALTMLVSLTTAGNTTGKVTISKGSD